MKLTRLIVMGVVVGALSVMGCSEDSGSGGTGGGGTAGDGGTGGMAGDSGTGGMAGDGGTGGMAGDGGTGGGGIVCDPTPEQVCAECDNPELSGACVTTFEACLLDPPNLEACDSCGFIGRQACGL